MSAPHRGIVKGRGSSQNPPSRFARIHLEDDFEQWAYEDEASQPRRSVSTEYLIDDAQTVISENDSPDIPLRYSLNPYRGCAHGCAYCYARPTHEYLGLSAGLDFETKILVKEQAPKLFRDHLSRVTWVAEPIALSGVTDAYQPAERTFQLTRQCLQVAWEARQPISIVTKNALVIRDLDILTQMASLRLVHVALSLTTLDQTLARVMEPRTSSPAARLAAVAKLSEAKIPTAVLVAPIIPSLNDVEIPAILQAAKDHGAVAARYTLLRLPPAVQPVFLAWLEQTQPAKRARIESRIRSTHGGALCETQFGTRMTGSGEFAAQIGQAFRVFSKRYGLDRELASLDVTQFRSPGPRSNSEQLRLFE